MIFAQNKTIIYFNGVRKLLNKINNYLEYKRGALILKSMPTNYAIGLTNTCNLRCPFCITGLRKQDKDLMFIDLELFKSIIDKIRDHAYLVQLYKWGEPLLHKDIIVMLEYCNRYDLNTEISSNLNIEDDARLEAMVKHRLKRLIISFDGVTQADYERYRVGGNLGLVLNNIKKIKEYKDKYISKYPRISLQYLKSKFTKYQIRIIREHYKKWGADDFYVCDMTTVFKDRNREREREWFNEEEISRRKYLDIDVSMHGKRCYFLYTTMIIEQDGSIPPCCFATEKKDDFSKWDFSRNIAEMFNSEKFVKAREMFVSKKSCDVTCKDCTVFTTYCAKHN